MDASSIRLYKYLSLGTCKHIKRAKRIFTESEIYFATPAQFNDPFDCKFDVTIEGDVNDWKRYLKDALRRQGKEPLSDSDLDDSAANAMNNRIAVPEEAQHHAVEQTRKSVRVLSLSGRNSSILMWSHYADNHSGICLELSHLAERPFIDTSEGKRFVLEPRKVEYTGPFPKLNFFDMVWGRVKDPTWLLRKHEDWKYEREYRVFGPPSESGIFKLPETSLTGVILGSRISRRNRERVLGWAADRKQVDAYEAIARSDAYELEIRRIH